MSAQKSPKAIEEVHPSLSLDISTASSLHDKPFLASHQHNKLHLVELNSLNLFLLC